MTAFNDTFGIIGFSSENVGIDRRIYTGLTSTNPQLNVSYNGGRVDVYLNGVKLMGNHSGQSNYDYTYQNTGQGSAITLSTGVALVAEDTIECVGYVSNSSNTVQTYNFNVTTNTTAFTASHTASSLVNVYLNGVLLDSSDYTLNGSDTVTLGSNAVSGDVVHIQVIGALDNSNFVPASGGTFSGDVGIGQSPGKKLDVGGDVRIRGDAGTLNFYRTTSPTDVATIEYNNSDSALKFWAKNKAINFSSADADQDSSHLYIKGTTGNVGIGTNDPKSPLNISDSAGATTFIVTDPTRNAAGEHWYLRNTLGNFYIGQATDSSGAWDSLAARLAVLNGGDINVMTGNLVIGTAGKGIDFSAQTQSTSYTPSSEILDHYEEGTWSIDVQGATVAGTDAYTGTPLCHYTKIGRQVTITFAFTLASLAGYSGSTFKFKGLPFNTMPNFESSGSVMLNNYNITNTFNALQVTTYIGGNYDYFYVYVSQDDGSWNQINDDVQFGMIGSLTYFTS